MGKTIDGLEMQAMVRHWLNTPVCGYLGSDYGQDVKSLLQLPMSDGAADAFLAKLREDVLAVSALPPEAINLYGVRPTPERLELFIEIAGQTVQVGA
jgi:hypothetical protein